MHIPITTKIRKARVGLTLPQGMKISISADGSGKAIPETNTDPAGSKKK